MKQPIIGENQQHLLLQAACAGLGTGQSPQATPDAGGIPVNCHIFNKLQNWELYLSLYHSFYCINKQEIQTHLMDPPLLEHPIQPPISNVSSQSNLPQRPPRIHPIVRKTNITTLLYNEHNKASSKDSIKQDSLSIQKYMANRPLKQGPSKESGAIKFQTVPHEPLQAHLGTGGNAEGPGLQKNSSRIQLRGDSKGKLKEESADYYKYWKKKANEYQQSNFNLHRLNSALQQQNQILKHQNQKLEKKILKMAEPEPSPQAFYDYDKLEQYYRVKIDQLTHKISEQELLIGRQDKKIKELSKYISENYKLKNLLANMEEKMTELHSFDSGSRPRSTQKISEKEANGNSFPNILESVGTPNEKRYHWNLRDKPHANDVTENRSSRGRGY